VKLSKYKFSIDAIDFLSYRIRTAGVSMDMSRVRTIQEWPKPESYRDIQIFIGFCNFYRRFIFRFSAVIAPLINLLKGMVKGRKMGPFDLTDEGHYVFKILQ
jgi:hypothetical protein